MAEYDSPILLLGETNTGKEAFARLIHCASRRAAKPFITVNCAAIPETQIESRLFGHLKEAFPGADGDHQGCFEEANGGTLFLDALDGLPAPCQAKLLRAMEYGKIQRLGDDQESGVNVRVIAATNFDIKNVIEDKTPRKDLYRCVLFAALQYEHPKEMGPNAASAIASLAARITDQANIVPFPSAAGR